MSQHHTETISAAPLHFSQTYAPSIIFSLLADQPWAMWLDSCKSDHVDSHFDIMVWQPITTVVTDNALTTVTDIQPNVITTSTEDPLALLEKTQQKALKKYVIKTGELPFYGGSLGYFSYDLGRCFEALPSNAIKDINMPEMAVGIYNQAIIYDRKKQCYFLACPDQQRAELTQQLQQLLTTKETQKKTKTLSFKLSSTWQSNISKQEYNDKFNQVQAYLLSGDCYQINLTQRFSATYQGDEFSAYLALREKNQAPFSAFMRFNDRAILSVSPERFLKLNDNKVQSKPIKGTQVRSNDPIQDRKNYELLLNSEKDRAENLMIVDLLRNDISRVCQAGSVKVPALFAIESFPAVHHLVSTVEGELSPQFNACDLLRASFPGGSITGAPKIRAMEIIDELEPQRRSIYCGSIGYVSACGKMDTSITIRTLVCQQQSIYCWAGGGIVADSQVDAEYQESFDKVNKILPVLSKL
ncbi:MAG: aminodeoxychorismate synthase component I [Thalassotalea sp.]